MEVVYCEYCGHEKFFCICFDICERCGAPNINCDCPDDSKNIDFWDDIYGMDIY